MVTIEEWSQIKITPSQLIKTCDACPSQWEGMLNTGQSIYCRYRHGQLRIHVSKNVLNESEKDDMGLSALLDGYIIHQDSNGGEFDGFMLDEELYIILHKINILKANFFQILFYKLMIYYREIEHRILMKRRLKELERSLNIINKLNED